MKKIDFDRELIKKYDREGPRYTSYPTAPQFTNKFTQKDLHSQIDRSNAELIPKPLSLYVHIPFCDTICYYCACNKIITKDHSRSEKYLDLLSKELKQIAPQFDSDRKLTQLHFGGGTPTFLNNDQLSQIMREIEIAFPMSHDCEKSIEIDPRKASNDTIYLLAEMGFNRISLGVQDFDEKVQKAVNRIQSIELVESRIETARDAGINSINMDLIYGLPLQTVDTFSKTIDSVIQLKPNRLSVFNYAHLPERFKPQRRINEQDLPSPEEKLAILEMIDSRLQDAGYTYIGMDHFALADDEMTKAQEKNTLQRNFQGYSTNANTDLIGIGVSSISHINDSYSQNVTVLDEYEDLLSKNKAPLKCGFLMSWDDRLRKHIIDQLICHFYLDISEIERNCDINFEDYFESELSSLSEMQADGLLTLTKDSITVHDKGRMLIRNICMVFDYYLNKNNTVKFSRAI